MDFTTALPGPLDFASGPVNRSDGVHIDWRNTSGKGAPRPSPR